MKWIHIIIAAALGVLGIAYYREKSKRLKAENKRTRAVALSQIAQAEAAAKAEQKANDKVKRAMDRAKRTRDHFMH